MLLTGNATWHCDQSGDNGQSCCQTMMQHTAFSYSKYRTPRPENLNVSASLSINQKQQGHTVPVNEDADIQTVPLEDMDADAWLQYVYVTHDCLSGQSTISLVPKVRGIYLYMYTYTSSEFYRA